VVPIYDPRDRFVPSGALQQGLESVFRLEGNFELILVNNNRLEETPRLTGFLRSFAARRAERVRLVEPDRNAGTAGGFNAGFRIASPERPYLVFMSQDAELVDHSMLPKIEEDLRRRPRIGVAHPMSVFEDVDSFNVSRRFSVRRFYRRARVSDGHGDLGPDEIHSVLSDLARRSGVATALRSFPLTFAILRRSALEEVGTFDERFGLGCHENDDLAFRMVRSGRWIGRLDRVFVNHRRVLFRRLSTADSPDADEVPHADALRESTRRWKEKWGRPYAEVYTEWRFGRGIMALMRPYFWLRRLAFVFWRGLVEHRLRSH
jgi:GT2 family glycosyltransferase